MQARVIDIRHDRGNRCSEGALVRAAQDGDEAASIELIRRYGGLVRRRARHYFLVGADRDDVTQEGMVGLCKAIRDYDPGREASFRSFAELCVTRQILSAVKSSTRHKHGPLNGYISLTSAAPDEHGRERPLADTIAAGDLCDPAEIVIDAWGANSLRCGVLDVLSSFERDVLQLYSSGLSYRCMCERLGRHSKAIDNALQRIKRKTAAQVRRAEGNC